MLYYNRDPKGDHNFDNYPYLQHEPKVCKFGAKGSVLRAWGPGSAVWLRAWLCDVKGLLQVQGLSGCKKLFNGSRGGQGLR